MSCQYNTVTQTLTISIVVILIPQSQSQSDLVLSQTIETRSYIIENKQVSIHTASIEMFCFHYTDCVQY